MRGTPEFRRLLSAAEQAAKAGGAVVRMQAPGATQRKGAGDYVSDADREAERAIGKVLLGQTPDIPVFGEEFGGEPADRYWLVDPIDGTTNFLHGFPAVGVSVALIQDGRPVVGVVAAPLLDDVYTAIRDGGAQVRRGGGAPVPLSVSDRDPSRAIVATGFPFRAKERTDRHLAMVRDCLHRFEDLRRPGAASLDLAWTAAGVFDGFFELGLSTWDVAAGALLVEEAGGRVSDWSGGPGYLSGDILAGSPAVQAELGRAAAASGSASLEERETAQDPPRAEQDERALFEELGGFSSTFETIGTAEPEDGPAS